MESITIEEAIAKVSGDYSYQKRALYILSLSQLTLTFMIMGTPYMVPSVDPECNSQNVCSLTGGLKNSATEDFQLFGEKKYLTGIVGTTYFAGMMLGVLFLGWFSDSYGRVKSIYYFTIIGVPILAFVTFSWNIWVIIIAYFFVGLLEIGIYTPGFIVITESTKASHRNIFSGIYFSIWGVFTVLISMLYYFSVPWRLTIALSLLTLFVQIFLMRYIYESPHFLLANNKNIDETIKVLNSISLINGAGPFTSDIKHIEIEENVSHSYLSFFKHGHLFTKFLICTVLWFSIVLAYFGMLFIMPSLFPDLYIEGAVMAIAETIGCLVATYFVNILGRKNCTIGCFSVSGLCFALIWVYPTIFSDSEGNWVILGFWFVARFVICCEFFIIYIYTAELFPTRVRNMAYSMCNAIGRIAGMISSNMIAICESLGVAPLAVLAVVLIGASISACFLEETLGKNMPEFVEENNETCKEENNGSQVSYKRIN